MQTSKGFFFQNLNVLQDKKDFGKLCLVLNLGKLVTHPVHLFSIVFSNIHNNNQQTMPTNWQNHQWLHDRSQHCWVPKISFGYYVSFPNVSNFIFFIDFRWRPYTGHYPCATFIFFVFTWCRSQNRIRGRPYFVKDNRIQLKEFILRV